MGVRATMHGPEGPKAGRTASAGARPVRAPGIVGVLVSLLALTVYFPTSALAAGSGATGITPVTLQHREARELLPLVRPVLPPGVAITGRGRHILIRGTAAERRRIRALLAKLDTAPRRLLITVRPIATAPTPGSVVRYGTDGAVDERNPNTRVYTTGTAPTRADVEQVRVLDGHAARIELGAAVPVVEGDVWVGTNGTATSTSPSPVIAAPLRYREVTRGFDVVARTEGKQVTVTIRAHRERRSDLGGGAIAHERVATTVRGPLGQWIDLGGPGPVQTPGPDERRYATTHPGAYLREFQVKVTVLRPQR